MSSLVFNGLNQIGIAEGNPYIFIFYYCKGNHVGNGDTKIAGVDEAPNIAGVDKDTDEQD